MGRALSAGAAGWGSADMMIFDRCCLFSLLHPHLIFPLIMLLSPPKITRTRASSTSRCNALTLSSLGRRRSASCLVAENQQQPDIPPIDTAVVPPPTDESSPTMLDWMVSKLIHWIHVPQKHALSWSTPSSPRSSTDDLILPLSASAQTLTFSVPEPKNLVPQDVSWWSHIPPVRLLPWFTISIAHLFSDPYTYFPRHHAIPNINRVCILVSVDASHISLMATQHRGPCPDRSRTAWLLSERSWSSFACHWCYGYLCHLETRLVHPR